jgi:hypothetical protein
MPVPVPLVLVLPTSGVVAGSVAALEFAGDEAVPAEGAVLVVSVDAVVVAVSVDAVLPVLSLRWQAPSTNAAAAAISDRLALRKVVSFMCAP